MQLKIAALAIAIAGTGVTAQAQTQITGAGSTFAAPIYAKWGEAAGPVIGVKLNYQAIGSGAGSTRSTIEPLISAPPTCR